MNTDTLYHQYRNYFQAAGSGWQLGEDGRRLRSGARQRHLALEMCVDGFGLRADAVAGEQVGYGVGFLAAVGGGARFAGGVVHADGVGVGMGFALPAQAAADCPAARVFRLRGVGGRV